MSDKTRMTAGERIVQNFLQEGVEILFSHGELSLMDIQQHALRKGLRMVGARHESAGVFMAAAYYRLTGKPQVAMGAQGPGAANMLPGAVSCRAENIPVVLVGASRQHESTTGVRTGRFLHGDTLWPAQGPDAPKGASVKVTGTNGTVLVVELAAASAQ